MNVTNTSKATYDLATPVSTNQPLTASAVSWGAILAGAAGAAALSLILLLLGTGLGLSSVSPWARSGVSASTFGISTILWITFTQVAAAGVGGYLAGRLRTKWISVHTDEVYFRDTAHGFLAWAVATLATAALLTSVISSIVGSGIEAGTAVAGGIAATTTAAAGGATQAGMDMKKSDGTADPMGYFIDALFRKDSTTTAAENGANNVATTSESSATTEVTRIFINAVSTGTLPSEDLRYVGHIVAARTGISQPEAEKRVNEVFVRVQTKLHDAEVAVKQAADAARKTSAHAALWLFVSLLIAAFVASLSATFGGRQRDC